MNLNDKTIEGFRCDSLAAMGVQFMPDLSGEDLNNVFTDFMAVIEKGIVEKNNDKECEKKEAHLN